MCFNEDWIYQVTFANNFCLLELIYVTLGHLDDLQKADYDPIRWSLYRQVSLYTLDAPSFQFLQVSMIPFADQNMSFQMAEEISKNHTALQMLIYYGLNKTDILKP